MYCSKNMCVFKISRVAKWVIASHDMDEVSDNENKFSSKTERKAKFKKRLSTERTNSLLGER